MTISITISGNGPEELRAAAQRVAAFFTPSAPANEALKGEVIDPPAAPAPGKPGRKKTTTITQPPKQADIEEVIAEQEAELDAPVPTHDDVVEALKKVNGAHGMGAVREIIGAFNCQKISEVKPDNFAAVIAAATEKLAA